MMKTLNVYKYLIAALFISLLFTGCSHKSKGTNNPILDGNSTEVGFAGSDQNVTVDTPFTVTANSTLDGNITYKWSEGNTTLSNEASYTGTLGQGAHTLTATATSSNGQIQSDTVSIKIGKYFIKRAYTDENGDGTIDTVQVYTYDIDGKLLKVETYDDVNGEREPEKNGIKVYETILYNYDVEGNLTGTTIEDKDGVKNNSNTDSESTETSSTVENDNGSSTTTVNEADGTVRIFNYNDKKVLTSGTAKYTNGTASEYKYEYDEKGNRIKEILTTTDKDGKKEIQTTSYDDKGNVIKIETVNGEGTVVSTSSTEYEYIFMWKYKD